MAATGLIFLVGLSILKQSMHLEADAFGLTKLQTMILAGIRAASIAMPLLLIVLISKKADDDLRDPTSSFATASWFAILSPCFLFSLFRGLSTTFSSFVMTLRGMEGWKGMFCKEVFSWMFAHLLFLVGIGLVGEKLQSPETTSRPWGTTFVPWFIVSGGLTLLTCCFTCTFSSAMSQMQEMEEQQRRAQEYEQAREQNGTTTSNVTGGRTTTANEDVPRPATTVIIPSTNENTTHSDVHNDSSGSIDSNSPIILGGPTSTTNGGYGSSDEH